MQLVNRKVVSQKVVRRVCVYDTYATDELALSNVVLGCQTYQLWTQTRVQDWVLPKIGSIMQRMQAETAGKPEASTSNIFITICVLKKITRSL